MAGLDAFPTDLQDSPAGDDGPLFKLLPVDLDLHSLGVADDQRVVAAAAACGCVLIAFQSGEVVRWWNISGELQQIDLGRSKPTDITKVLLEPKGFHSIIVCATGDTWYLNFQSAQAKPLQKLKAQNHIIEAVSWDGQSTDLSTKDAIFGTLGGHIMHLVVDGGKEKTLRTMFAFEHPGQMRPSIPICGLHRERLVSSSDGGERLVLFVAAGCGIYAFVGTSFETLFQKYQGDAAWVRALVYEVPRDSPHGELHVDSACAGSPSTKVLFWLTGVGVLSAAMNNPLDPDASPLESPPGLIPFPRPAKAQASHQGGGNLVATLLPPPPPPSPLSMALTKFHIVFIFEDRWAVISRITHKVVHQQPWSSGSFGALRCLARDANDSKLWMFSERRIYDVAAENEDRNTWALLLQLEQYEAALQSCQKASERARVLAAHADCLFRHGKYLDSARKFGEAKSVPFEHVALRFLAANCKAALLEYFQCRLKQCLDDEERKVARALLGTWAVELSLANLHDLQLRVSKDKRPQAAGLLDAGRARLHELLRSCAQLDIHPLIYHMLRSHGRLDELVLFAEARRDFETVVLHHVGRHDCANALRKLADFQAMSAGVVSDLLVCLAPTLFGAEPTALVSLLVRPEFASIASIPLLPAVYVPDALVPHSTEAVRYLEHIVVQLQRASTGQEDTEGQTADALILNALTVFYANQACMLAASSSRASVPLGSAPLDEDSLLRFFEAQESNPNFDAHFALRVCSERSLGRAVVLLYGMMGMHEEAVKSALQRGDVKLAKHNANRPSDPRLRKKLWVDIVDDQATRGGDVQVITGLIRESQELSVRDVLPFMSDSMTIEGFQAEILETLESYEGQILTLMQEMDEHRRALNAFKDDLKVAQEREVVVAANQLCEICGRPVLQERFYVFACKHCFHEACLRDLVVPTLQDSRRDRFWALEKERIGHAAASAGAATGGDMPVASLATVEDELDGILAEDCPLCGRLMIDTIQRPFVDPDETAEIQAWAI